jgi:hypothetical protein
MFGQLSVASARKMRVTDDRVVANAETEVYGKIKWESGARVTEVNSINKRLRRKLNARSTVTL